MSKTLQCTIPAALMDSAALVKAIDGVNKAATALQYKYQEVAMHCLMHCDKTGDIGMMNRLIVGMPKGVRRNAMASWALAYGKFMLNTDAATKKDVLFKFDKTKTTDLEGANSDPWFEHLPEKPVDEVFDLQKAIHAILKKAEGKSVSMGGKTLDGKVAADTLKALKALAGDKPAPTPGELAAAAA